MIDKGVFIYPYKLSLFPSDFPGFNTESPIQGNFSARGKPQDQQMGVMSDHFPASQEMLKKLPFYWCGRQHLYA